MKLFTKIFFGGTLVFSLAFLMSGYFLIHYSMKSNLKRETDLALRQYQYDKFTVQAGLLAMSNLEERFSQEEEKVKTVFAALAEDISVPAAFLGEDFTPLYSEIEEADLLGFDKLSENAHIYRLQNNERGSCILTGGMFSQNGRKLYFITRWDIGNVVEQQETLIQYFVRCYCLVMTAGMAVITALAAFLSHSLKKMTRAADRMAKGDYEKRLAVSGKDEIGELAVSFNRLADAIEEKLGELQETARQKEDFVADFAHELKTPLTSVIGYADMLYQKELPREKVKEAAWYIWNEGMRLEALSLKLMDLIVLNRQDFPLQEMRADHLLEEVSGGLYPVFLEKGIAYELQAAQVYIRVDYDLFKTLLLNIIDNSIKAGCSRIELRGSRQDGRYRITVNDNGRGIPKEELSRITEPFYMVDKSRSRKQHGAGLGLALAKKIAQLHGSELLFESEEGKGTRVTLSLPCDVGEISKDE